MSSKNLGDLEDWGYDYILSTNGRKEKLARNLLVEDVPGSDQARTREVQSEEGEKVHTVSERGNRSWMEDLRKFFLIIILQGGPRIICNPNPP